MGASAGGRMPSSVMDQRRLSPFCLPPDSSSFFSDELRFPTERQVGFWKPESLPDHLGTEGMRFMPGSKSASSSPIEKLHAATANSVEHLELPHPDLFEDQKAKFGLEHHQMGPDRSVNITMTPWRTASHDSGPRSDLLVQSSSLIAQGSRVSLNGTHYENGLFSSSLSDMLDKKLRLSSNNIPIGQSVDTANSNFGDDEPFESMEEIEAQTIGNLLPDDDDLLAGVIDDLGYIGRPSNGDDMDDDIFCSGGGMELEADDNINGNKTSELFGGGALNGQQGGLNGPFAGEHPYGEHPSRTLFVRNINSNVEDAELRALFEQYGDIRTLYTACKHRGFVMISYYDIRSARNAMRALQNKPLRRRKLDIHFSIPKDNPSEKDINQGTLVVFNLDSSVSNDDLRQIFGVYGEIKEIRETPHKRHHKFIEFYDVRAAEAALRALNRSDIAGKKIKLEPSRPGGARRLMQQLSPELEQEELSGGRQGSPNNSPSGCFGSIALGAITSNGLENGGSQGLHSAIRAPISPFVESTFHGISSSVPQSLSSPVRIASVGNRSNQSIHGELSQPLGQMSFGFQNLPGFHPHSLPEYHNGLTNGIPYSSSNTMSSMGVNVNSGPADGIDNRHIHQVGSGSFSSHSFGRNESAYGVSGNGSCPLHGHQYVWNNSNAFHHHPPGPMLWSNSPSFVNNIPAHPPTQMHGLQRAPSHMLNTVLPLHHHHVGSAPAINPSLWDRRHGYVGDSTDVPAFHPGSLGSMGFSGSPQLHTLELASRNIFPHASGNCMDPSLSPAHVGIPSPQQRCHMFHGRNAMIPVPASFDAPNDRIRSRRSEASANQGDNKKQYELDIERIVRGEDSRTTLMIKNIPNKYTSKMLLAAIDEHHRGTYDFIYLPIDFKNKCNVGYAFINMIDPQHIIPFYQTFNGKKWEKFNSEKVASLAYARIQGKAALIAHFQNSSLMNEDKRCRPILFHSDGPNAGDQEPFPMGVNIRSRSGRSRAAGNEENHQGSPSTSANGEASCNGAGSPGSTKDLE
ncbi:protein MEI2-like 4 isoform X2 [Phoenix dactylifera]|uniref:Protein MEI2-like 4 isoform X2 n=1 Tax=Phoenix dactylifera TaxID=42345 RepID=A0A8B7C3L0_PHODC|nr:protein MEI2-like 4 isoform X2 [Phoenix dactylifera]